MKRLQVLAGSTVFIALTGCITYQVTGIVAESPGGTYAFADFTKSTIDAKPVFQKAGKSDVLVAGQTAVRADIQKRINSDKTMDYAVLFGPPVGSGGTASASLKINSDPSYELQSTGWIWAWRYWPFVGSPWVSAAAQGSTVVIEVPTATEAWIYYLDGTRPLPVECLRDKTRTSRGTTQSITVGQFIIVKDNSTACDFAAPDTIPATDPGGVSDRKHAFDFIEKVKPIATAAGWPL